jgi:hypothetical protein
MILASEFREALVVADFGRAARLFERYAHEVSTGIEAATAAPADLEGAGRMLELALAARAQLQRRLQELRDRAYVSARYR